MMLAMTIAVYPRAATRRMAEPALPLDVNHRNQSTIPNQRAPVMYEDISEARNTAPCAASSGVPLPRKGGIAAQPAALLLWNSLPKASDMALHSHPIGESEQTAIEETRHTNRYDAGRFLDRKTNATSEFRPVTQPPCQNTMPFVFREWLFA